MVTMDEVQGLLFSGGDVVDRDGKKIGSIGQLFLDASTGEPAWVTVNTGLFGTGESFVPLRGATVRDEALHVPWDKGQVKHAPRLGTEGALSEDEERELESHYGLRDDAGAAGDDVAAEPRPTGDLRPWGTVDDPAAAAAEPPHPVDARVGTTPDADAWEHQVRADGTTPVPPPPPTADPAPPLPDSPDGLVVAPGSELDTEGGPDAAGAGTAAGLAGAGAHRLDATDAAGPDAGSRVVDERAVDEQAVHERGGDERGVDERGVDERHAEGADGAGGMVLRAERARVIGTERVPTERVRLRRYTVTEERTITVPVTREEFRVEYEPAEGGPPLGDDTGTTDRDAAAPGPDPADPTPRDRA